MYESGRALAGLERANHFTANDNFAGFDFCVDAGVGADSEDAIGKVNFSFELAIHDEIFPARDFSFDLDALVTQAGASEETGAAAAGRRGEGTVDGRAFESRLPFIFFRFTPHHTPPSPNSEAGAGVPSHSHRKREDRTGKPKVYKEKGQ